MRQKARWKAYLFGYAGVNWTDGENGCREWRINFITKLVTDPQRLIITQLTIPEAEQMVRCMQDAIKKANYYTERDIRLAADPRPSVFGRD